ncbi:MAG: hypothetical protein ACOC9C_03120 [Chloroflexota bacterium]
MVDLDINTVTLYIYRFTDYNLMNGTEMHSVVLPMIVRQHGLCPVQRGRWRGPPAVPRLLAR